MSVSGVSPKTCQSGIGTRAFQGRVVENPLGPPAVTCSAGLEIPEYPRAAFLCMVEGKEILRR